MKTFDEEPEEDEGIKESQMDEDLKQADGTGRIFYGIDRCDHFVGSMKHYQ